MNKKLLFFSNTFEWRSIFFDIHESAGVSITFYVQAGLWILHL